MKERDGLIRQLGKIIQSEVDKDAVIRERMKELEKLGMKKTFSASYLTLRENLNAADDVTLYYLTCVYLTGQVKKYFLADEIKQYKKVKLQTEDFNRNITLHAIQIADNQWIGRITAKELMKWRDAQIINYNENAQRAMKHIMAHGRDYYQIFLNQNAVASIISAFEQESYIPNTLTFNVPESIDVHYDDDLALLNFNLDTQMLDILDGYHRYIALSNVSRRNPDFDYNLEIRIVQFSDSVAQQFIWQEDQKTKMKKVHSDAMNQNKLSNRITQRVNENPNCDFYQNITANGLINKGYFSAMVHQMFCKRIAQKDELIIQKKATQTLVDYLNWVASKNESLLQKPWDKRTIYAIVFMASQDIKDIPTIKRVLNDIHSEENLKYVFNKTEITVNDIRYLYRIVKGGAL